MNTIFLASGSPRRAELLRQMGLPFRVLPQDIDETFLSRRPRREALRLAAGKVEALTAALAASEAPPDRFWALGADTFVVRGGHLTGIRRLLGKPADRDEARRMLRRLSGRVQTVITGLALRAPSGHLTLRSCETRVLFARLSDREIEWYLDSGEWEGAAGAYRIQGKGGCLVRSIKGSYTNVMGLPIQLLYGILQEHQYPFG